MKVLLKSCSNIWRHQWTTMSETSEQHWTRPVNKLIFINASGQKPAALLRKWTSLVEFFQDSLIIIREHLFSRVPLNGWFWTQHDNGWAWNRLFQGTLQWKLYCFWTILQKYELHFWCAHWWPFFHIYLTVALKKCPFSFYQPVQTWKVAHWIIVYSS